jgi:hypothetical protein
MDRFIGSSSPGSIFFEIRFTKIDGCRIKSGHDGCVLWREVRQRFTHYFQIQFSNSQGNSERDASAKTVIARSEATIAVGTLIAERPPHRTVRAAFPHTAPTLGA